MAELLVFWGGWQAGFDGFTHNPVDYPASVTCSTLLMHGQNDPRVRVAEVEAIHTALTAPKTLRIFTGLGHQSYVEAQPEEWRKAIEQHLATLTNRR